MKKIKAKVLFLLLIYMNAMCSQFSYAAVDSTMITPQATTNRKLCYDLVVDGVHITGTAKYVASTLNVATMCANVGSGGGFGMGSAIVPVFMAGGGNLALYCPPEYPYLKSYNETWGMAFLFWFIINFYGGGAASNNVRCCKAPFNVTSITSSWETPDSNGKCASGI